MINGVDVVISFSTKPHSKFISGVNALGSNVLDNCDGVSVVYARVSGVVVITISGIVGVDVLGRCGGAILKAGTLGTGFVG